MITSTSKPAALRRIALSSAAALALLAYPLYGNTLSVFGFDAGTAQAQTHGSGQGGGGSGGQGGGGQGGGGYRGGKSTSGGGHTSTTSEDEDSDKKGPKFQGGENTRKPAEGTTGGKPVWAQEGIPEVELGRLNVARAPATVIDKALAEAVANFSPVPANLYNMTAEAFAAYVAANYDTVVRIDSPLENLGLYKDVVSDGVTQLPGVTPASKVDLAAILLGSASDKTVPISKDTVVAITTIFGLTLTDAEMTSLAVKAEAVRAAILTGHGE